MKTEVGDNNKIDNSVIGSNNIKIDNQDSSKEDGFGKQILAGIIIAIITLAIGIILRFLGIDY